VFRARYELGLYIKRSARRVKGLNLMEMAFTRDIVNKMTQNKSRSVLRRMRNVADIGSRRNQNTLFVFRNALFSKIMPCMG